VENSDKNLGLSFFAEKTDRELLLAAVCRVSHYHIVYKASKACREVLGFRRDVWKPKIFKRRLVNVTLRLKWFGPAQCIFFVQASLNIT